MMQNYFTQNATWYAANGTDEYGQPKTTSTNIKVRWDYGSKLFRDKNQQEQVGSGTLYCVEPIKNGDMVSDPLNDPNRKWVVLKVDAITDLDGNVAYHEVTV